MNEETFSFVIYMLHACAHAWGRSPADVYHALTRAGCIQDYLVPLYDVLHTMDTRAEVADIEEYLWQTEPELF